MDFDATMLARIQFGFTISFHIIFPAFTIGLSAYIATLLVMWKLTERDRYRKLARFWTKIFAVSFAMGVVSGIVLSYQFGTNWSEFSRVTGNVIGPLMGYEVLTAFFLEATFLGVMLFGWNRVSPWLHVTSAIMVAIGTLMSAFWILSANSWMQFPTGHEVIDGIAYPVDWWEIVFNPTFPYRFLHMTVAAYLTTSFVVIGVGARYALRGQHPRQAYTMLRMGLVMAAVLAPLQAFIGDQHGLNTLEYQPAKVAAMEAHWGGEENAEGGVPLILFAWPEAETNHSEVAIPNLGSLILTHSWDGQIRGLKSFAKEDRPPVAGPFFSFRVMVGLGLLMIAVSWAGVILWWSGGLVTSTWFLRVASMTWPVGFIAILAGWYTTENGRQPWVVTGVLRTADAVSPLAWQTVLVSLALFVFVYGIVFSAGIYYMNRLINKGPSPTDESDIREGTGTPSRPLSGAEGSGRAAIQGGEV